MRMVITLLIALAGCRGPAPHDTGSQDIARLVDSLKPVVERAAGLTFKTPIHSAMKSKEEVRAVLLAKLQQEFPAARQEGIEAGYKLLGLIPDTLDLKALLLELYSEQVAGFYDPDSRTLYGVTGADPATLRFVLAHELVHALQHQYLPLDSLMHLRSDADQQTAAQAVLEGEATLASIAAMIPDRSVMRQPGFWSMARDQVRAQSSSMAVFAHAPLVLREGLIFPYLSGAEFMRWWDSARAGRALPSLAELPKSSEQILHPDRYDRGDQPIPIRFAEPATDVLHEDTFGELEIQVLATVLRGGGEVLDQAPLGWGGDRFRVYRSATGPALVWFVAWDDAAAEQKFLGGPGTRLRERTKPGYRTTVEIVAGASHPTLRIVMAPTGWNRWGTLPGFVFP